MKNPAEAGFQARPESVPQVMGRSGLVACRERPGGLRAQGGLGCRGRLGGGRLLRSGLLGRCSLLRSSGLLGCCSLLHGGLLGGSGSLLGGSAFFAGALAFFTAAFAHANNPGAVLIRACLHHKLVMEMGKVVVFRCRRIVYGRVVADQNHLNTL